jgi:hypothetical protein
MHRPGYVQGGQEAKCGYLLLGIYYRRIRSDILLFVNAHDTLSLLFQSPTWIYVRVSCSEMGVEEGGIFQIFVALSESMVAHLFSSFPQRKFHPG